MTRRPFAVENASRVNPLAKCVPLASGQCDLPTDSRIIPLAIPRISRATTFPNLVAILVAILVATGAPLRAADPDPKPTSNQSAESTKPTAAELERRFEEQMHDVSLVGFFTASDKPSGKLSEDRYVIEKVVKDKDDIWTFHTRVQYGMHDVPLQLKVPVKWAGDTPVISVTKMSIPLLGTFSARVVLYEGQYAGTWSGAGHGGQLFGRIEKNKGAAKPEKKNAQPSADKPAPDATTPKK
jgi:hypothetical protein